MCLCVWCHSICVCRFLFYRKFAIVSNVHSFDRFVRRSSGSESDFVFGFNCVSLLWEFFILKFYCYLFIQCVLMISSHFIIIHSSIHRIIYTWWFTLSSRYTNSRSIDTEHMMTTVCSLAVWIVDPIVSDFQMTMTFIHISNLFNFDDNDK